MKPKTHKVRAMCPRLKAIKMLRMVSKEFASFRVLFTTYFSKLKGMEN